MTPRRDLQDTIVIIIILNSLHKDFDMTTARQLETNDKIINKIYNILQPKEVENLSKQAATAIKNLVMVFCD